MKSGLLLLLLLIPMLALADNYVVVGDSAPASDVVIAANFAASMKAMTGTVYQSALESTVKEDLESPGSDTYVVIDGKKMQARIIGKDDPIARDYLMQQDFAVNTVIERDDDREEKRIAAPPVEVEDDSDDVVIVPIAAEIPAPAVVDTEIVVEDEVPEPVPVQVVPEEKPGIFARFFAWLADVF